MLLYGNSAFFRFAVELVNDMPEDRRTEMARTFTADDQVLERFWSWLRENEIMDDSELEALRSEPRDVQDVAVALRVEVLNATLGLDDGYRVALESDEQYQAALEHLPEAQDFWIAWQAANLE
jgi:hypothetical protein